MDCFFVVLKCRVREFFRTFRFSRFLHVSFFKSSTFRFAGFTDCLVFYRNILAIRQLTTKQLSAYCLDGLLMKRELSDEKNYQMKGIQTTGIVCVGRILKTGIWVLQH